MEMMKSDMGGGAAVVGAMLAIAQLKPKINVIGIVPTTENLPSGKAINPGAAVTGSVGKTIALLNPDPQGGLLLLEGITYPRMEADPPIEALAAPTGWLAR